MSVLSFRHIRFGPYNLVLNNKTPLVDLEMGASLNLKTIHKQKNVRGYIENWTSTTAYHVKVSIHELWLM